jgi:hypothetical protein
MNTFELRYSSGATEKLCTELKTVAQVANQVFGMSLEEVRDFGADVVAVSTTEAPAEVVEAPAEVVEAPAEVVEATAEVVEAPAEVVEAPAEVVEAPAEVVEAPAAKKAGKAK